MWRWSRRRRLLYGRPQGCADRSPDHPGPVRAGCGHRRMGDGGDTAPAENRPAPFSSQTVAVLENYVFQWRITGSRWKQDWVWNPEGLSVKETEENRLLLERINPPAPSADRAAGAPAEPDESGRLTGRDFAQGVYRYLTDCRADAMLRYRVRRLEEAGEPLWPEISPGSGMC